MSDHVYHNFDLLVEPISAGYRARVTASPSGEGNTAFAAPFTTGELASFPLAAPTLESARDLGGRLHAAVFAGSVRDVWQRSLQAAELAGAGLRLRLRLGASSAATPVSTAPSGSLTRSEPGIRPAEPPQARLPGPDLAAWPWEFLYDAGSGQFLALSTGTPVVRYFDLPGSSLPLAVVRPLRLLAALASPAGYPPVDAAAEWEGMQEALAPLVVDDRLMLDRLAPPTLAALQRCLRQSGPHIFHFVGHGAFDAAVGEGQLVWEDGTGRAHVAPAARLATVLHDARATLRLVVLNACAGAQSGPADPFGGMAQALVRSGIPAVVAAQAPLANRSALTLAHEFYAAIADGLPVDAALAEARKALFVREGDMAWGSVLLFMRSPDGQLFAMPEAVEYEDRPPEEPHKQPQFHVEGSYIGRDLDNRGGFFAGRDYQSGS